IRIVPKSGAIINSLPQDGISGNHLERISKEIKPIIAEAIVLGMENNDINKLVTTIISTIKGE
ncbi:MAG: GntR family transcriptional regulator, partial [Sporosarcina sp.]